MKKGILVFLGIYLFLVGAPIFAEGSWHPVLNCEDGAAEVDNMVVATRGGVRVMAQIVIHDMNIIRYFNQAGVAKSGLLDTEWAAQGGNCCDLPPKNVYSFGLDSAFGETSSVTFDGAGLSVQLHSDYGAGSANWYFPSCSEE